MGWSKYGRKTDDIYLTNASDVHFACIPSENQPIEAAAMIAPLSPGVDTWVNYYKPPADVSLSCYAAH